MPGGAFGVCRAFGVEKEGKGRFSAVRSLVFSFPSLPLLRRRAPVLPSSFPAFLPSFLSSFLSVSFLPAPALTFSFFFPSRAFPVVDPCSVPASSFRSCRKAGQVAFFTALRAALLLPRTESPFSDKKIPGAFGSGEEGVTRVCVRRPCGSVRRQRARPCAGAGTEA